MNASLLSSLPGHGQLRRLVALRSLAIAAQLLTMAAVWKGLELALPWTPMLLTVAALAVANLLTWLRLGGAAGSGHPPAPPLRGLRLHSERPVTNAELFAQLCIDVAALTVLLYYGGGSTNPFVSLYLMPLVVAAATLPARYTWAMAALTTACYSVLMFHYVPLPHNHHHDGDSAFNAHVMGMWLGFVISAVVVAYFVVKMAQTVRSRDETLARVREDILRNERIVALGTQAASAAHELGTPLSTLSVVIGELRHDAPQAWHESLDLLDEQVRGCKRILDKMLAHAQDGVAPVPQPADRLLHDVLDEWQLLRPTAQYHYHAETSLSAPLIEADATLRAALMNLLNNAADASPQPVDIHAAWDDGRFMLEIRDHGKGLDEEAELKAGSAFFTTKEEGRGLGLFLANATIERLGGSVRLYNRAGGGATTELILPGART